MIPLCSPLHFSNTATSFSYGGQTGGPAQSVDGASSLRFASFDAVSAEAMPWPNARPSAGNSETAAQTQTRPVPRPKRGRVLWRTTDAHATRNAADQTTAHGLWQTSDAASFCAFSVPPLTCRPLPAHPSCAPSAAQRQSGAGWRLHGRGTQVWRLQTTGVACGAPPAHHRVPGGTPHGRCPTNCRLGCCATAAAGNPARRETL